MASRPQKVPNISKQTFGSLITTTNTDQELPRPDAGGRISTSNSCFVHSSGEYPTPPQSASPGRSSFSPSVHDVFGANGLPSPRYSNEISVCSTPSESGSSHDGKPSRRRSSSLSARYPGDTSHRPLDMIRAEQRAANRPRRRTLVGADTIDRLDQIGANGTVYHHDGPYDATLLARNIEYNSSPVAATSATNQEAIRATPPEFIDDSLREHRPLSGTATVAPGTEDSLGIILEYNEGPNLNIEMGCRRWDGLKNHPNDVKGKGEPALSEERALNERKSHRRIVSDGTVELQFNPPVSCDVSASTTETRFLQAGKGYGEKNQGTKVNTSLCESDVLQSIGLRRAHTTGRQTSAMTNTLKSKFGSLRRRKAGSETI